MAKLKAARFEKRKENGRCKSRKPLVETNPDLTREARRLRRANPVTGMRKNDQRAANELFEMGFFFMQKSRNKYHLLIYLWCGSMLRFLIGLKCIKK